MTKLYGSLEAGGTKFVCAVGDENFQIIEKVQFPTTTPYETIEKTVAFFKRFEEDLAGIAIGSFGPIDIDQNSKTYGYITNTPKENWSNVDLVGLISKDFKVPFYFTTDVNSSAYGEVIVRKSINSLVYYTIGTGIGAGAIQNGEFIGGAGHTESGHTYVALHPHDVANEFNGVCPFHRGCLEGLACPVGPSPSRPRVLRRWPPRPGRPSGRPLLSRPPRIRSALQLSLTLPQGTSGNGVQKLWRSWAPKVLAIFIQKGLVLGNKFLLSYQLRIEGLTEEIHPKLKLRALCVNTCRTNCYA